MNNNGSVEGLLVGTVVGGVVRLKSDDTRRNQISSFAETDESI